jgi:hypothetical protein
MKTLNEPVPTPFAPIRKLKKVTEPQLVYKSCENENER